MKTYIYIVLFKLGLEHEKHESHCTWSVNRTNVKQGDGWFYCEKTIRQPETGIKATNSHHQVESLNHLQMLAAT